MTYSCPDETGGVNLASQVPLCRHFLRLAEETHSAGFRSIAEHLVALVYRMLDTA